MEKNQPRVQLALGSDVLAESSSSALAAVVAGKLWNEQLERLRRLQAQEPALLAPEAAKARRLRRNLRTALSTPLPDGPGEQ